MTIAIKDTVNAPEAASVMRLFPTRPRILALGEPTHGEEVLLDVRNELFRQLVEQEGYRTIAIESDCVAGLVVDDYVTSGTGTLDEAMEHGFSHPDLGLGASPANRELVRWMRAYNEGRPAAAQVRFAGFDGPLEITAAASPRRALTALHAYLAARVDADLLPCTGETLDRLLSDDDRWTDPEAMRDASRSVGRAPEAIRLRLLVDELAAVLDTQAPHLIATSSSTEWQRAHLYARTATGLLRYHYWMADPSPDRMARLCALRASLMAANLLALAERGPTLAYAHNHHLRRGRSSMPMWEGRVEWWGAGAIADARLGEGYAFLATALGTIPRRGVDAPPADTIEGMLYALPTEKCIVDVSRLVTVLGGVTPAPRVSPWFGYAPLDPAHLAGNDGIVFVRDTSAG